jgi:hypothetical protein
MEEKNMALRVAGVVFLLVALMHLLRVFCKVPVYVNGHHVRLTMSVAGFLVSLALSIWMSVVSRKK